jgi:hypothetical protein
MTVSAHAVEVLVPDPGPALVLASELTYVRETATGLVFREDTPLEVVGALIERLTRQSKRIEWALGDALQFAERRYGDTYAQWVEETGLSENTLATYRWVADRIEPLRRRKDVGWSHHREVAGIDDPAIQDRLLDEAADKGMTRWEVRQRVKAAQEQKRGHAVAADGAAISTEPLTWQPAISDLTAEARAALEAHAPGGRHRLGYEQGFLRGLIYAGARDCFTDWRAG